MKPRVKTPVTFDLAGQDAAGLGWTETFVAAPSIPGAMLLDFIADADSGDGGKAAQALVDFLAGVISPDDRDRFNELIRDPDKTVEIETLAEICEWLVGEYATRPTEPSRPSPTGRPRSGRSSTATVS